MYLEKVRIWNWRRFGGGNASKPAIEISFNKHLNVLLGENDSGKTAIIDAMRIGLNTNSQDVNWLREIDFYDIDNPIKIEYVYCELSVEEEAYFFEWVHFVKDVSYLRVLLEAEQVQDLNKKTRITKNVSGGEEGREIPLTDDVKQLLTVTYLKPLRDAEVELSPGNRSRFAQILKSLSVFQENDGASKKEIEEILTKAFEDVQNIIDSPVIGKMQDLVESFFDKTRKRNPMILPKNMKFDEFLKKLELNLGEIGSGLGSSNLLFMAAELLLLSDNKFGPQIALIEEIEAHIHPQSQLRLIKYFERKSKEEGIQYILTSHSPILASSIALEHVILIYSNAAFSMKAGETLLENNDYKFLERFLDSTKSNMFFAQGIICVEGDAENLLLPAIAEVVGRSLHDYGVSIVNVGNLAFKRYSSIFLRKNEPKLDFPVAIVTDLDLKPISFYDIGYICYFEIDINTETNIKAFFKTDKLDITSLVGKYDTYSKLVNKISKIIGRKINSDEELHLIKSLSSINTLKYKEILTDKDINLKINYKHDTEKTKVFISSPWTLEFSIAESGLSDFLQDAILEVHYIEESNRTRKKAEWSNVTNNENKAVEIYKFVLHHEISKAAIAQLLAYNILQKKGIVAEIIKKDEKLKYLYDAILHVTGGI
ncbi:AAA family ATPase [Paenibacillus sp. LjRoot153]|uniref:ATP-dependent nuclease n=1 Tax=Paenibacillus sp. LjRoot153 TaxID=3342270 RepID=UPI003ECE1549